jgi:hypothetical protein
MGFLNELAATKIDAFSIEIAERRKVLSKGMRASALAPAAAAATIVSASQVGAIKATDLKKSNCSLSLSVLY